MPSTDDFQPGGCRTIFIGGASQSGTSTLNALLAGHREILACPLETCFIVSAYGLMDVTRAIADEYCFFRLDPILYEFDRLMRHHLCSPRSYPYNRFDLAAFFGRDRYHAAIDQFFARLGVTRYRGDGLTIQPFARIGAMHSPFKFKSFWFPARIARERAYLYHAERQTRAAALDAARGLLDDLFTARARDDNKSSWCEQTSTNPLFADFLLELYPAGLLIYTVRDPLDVALAQQAQTWAPSDFTLVCKTLRGVYERWFAIREQLPPGSHMQVSFERLVDNPAEELVRVCDAIGVTYDPRMLARRPDAARVRRETARRRGADLVTYRRILGSIAEELGYSVP